MAMIVIRVKANPSLAGSAIIEVSQEDRSTILREIWPLPILILAVLGGIFSGLFSPTEAGAIGAFIAGVIAFIRGKLTRDALFEAVRQAIIATAGIFIILIGSLFFTRFLAMSGLPAAFADLILSVSSEPWWILLAITILYVSLGMLIDSIGLLLLTLPLILPLVDTTGLNPVWFGIIVIKLLEIGLVTPPIGLNVYMIKGSLGDIVTLPEVFKGVTWFIAMDFLTLLILILFPILSLWLPQLAFS